MEIKIILDHQNNKRRNVNINKIYKTIFKVDTFKSSMFVYYLITKFPKVFSLLKASETTVSNKFFKSVFQLAQCMINKLLEVTQHNC